MKSLCKPTRVDNTVPVLHAIRESGSKNARRTSRDFESPSPHTFSTPTNAETGNKKEYSIILTTAPKEQLDLLQMRLNLLKETLASPVGLTEAELEAYGKETVEVRTKLMNLLRDRT